MTNDKNSNLNHNCISRAVEMQIGPKTKNENELNSHFLANDMTSNIYSFRQSLININRENQREKTSSLTAEAVAQCIVC